MYRCIFVTILAIFSSFELTAEEVQGVNKKIDTMQVHASKMESKIEQYIKYNEEIEKIRSEKARLQEYLSLVRLKISVASEEQKLKEKTQPKPKAQPVNVTQQLAAPARPMAPKRKDMIPEVNILSFAEVGNRINGVIMMDGIRYSLNKKSTRVGKYKFDYGSGMLVVSTKDDRKEVYVE
ncbi:hypothetical protein KI655_05275 [Vibrio sp. D404a]|uniref:hypothetical protein n=1 Tax=unclassified Vibrio TaxID=2614977 RepID=UPI0025536A41|nr:MULTISPECIES: hypothetical protein [unclassified Vibrio]MDK9736706.1 hypothetical protein [Vibrio sp. D404a]MDK9797015.1 hypothetical protein [Vibrio sp. D449a]